MYICSIILNSFQDVMQNNHDPENTHESVVEVAGEAPVQEQVADHAQEEIQEDLAGQSQV